LLSNTGWNIAGQVLPLLVGIAVLPALIRTMGLDRYGFLTLVWVLVGYASVFDFGIGRALIRVVAMRLARGDVPGAHHVARVGMTFLGMFGLAIGAAFALASAWLVAHVFKLPAGLDDEAMHSMWLLAASLPFVMLTIGYVGVLSAHQKFRGLNILRGVMGVASYIGPLLVAWWVNRLDAVVGFVLLMRIVATAAHAAIAKRGCGFRFVPVATDRPTSRELLTIGGWMSVSNIVSPMLSYLDRLLLGTLVPMQMVAFYATPSDLVSRAMIVPYSLMAALFPAAAAVQPGTEDARQMLVQSVRMLFVLTFPLVFAIVVLAQPGLTVWLGADFASHAAPVLQLLAVGVFFNALAQAPATVIQAAGRPRLMAVLHLVELPLFVALLYFLTVRLGILGTATAAALRNGLDAVAVLALARHDVARGRLAWGRTAVPALLAALVLGLAFWPMTSTVALATFVVGLAAFAAYAWHLLLRADERSRLLHLLRVRA
jgi:O-antigen/teichoic acid export membrane protein